MATDVNEGMAKLYAKMAWIMGEVTAFKKDSKHQKQNYSFVSATQVFDRIRALMSEQNIAFFAEVDSYHMTETTYLVNYIFTFACADTGATKSCPWIGEAVHTFASGSKDDKAINKCATIAEKYFLLDTFVVSGEDTDEGHDTTSRKSSVSGRKNGSAPQKSARPKQEAPAATDEPVEDVAIAHVAKHDKTGRTYHVLSTRDHGNISIWTRSMFQEALWVDDMDWLEIDRPTKNLDIPVMVKPDGNHWEIVAVAPCTL